jgi:hypothetical protein
MLKTNLFSFVPRQLTNYNMQLEWSEHPRRLVEGVLQLHNASVFHDVTLSAEGKHIKAHRIILAAASTYFKVPWPMLNY